MCIRDRHRTVCFLRGSKKSVCNHSDRRDGAVCQCHAPEGCGDGLMAELKEYLEKIEKVIAQGPYKDTWELSLIHIYAADDLLYVDLGGPHNIKTYNR